MDKTSSELDYFSQLFSCEKQSRIIAVKGILKRIKQNTTSSQHVVYLICRRLVRGLGGSNPSFRQGCFTSVVGFFSMLPPELNIEQIEEIIESELNPTGNNSKQEEGEAYLGQILAYGAMIVSDYLLRKSEEDQFKVFEKIFQLSKKRSYLHHVAFVFMSLILKKVKKEQNPEGFIEHLKDLDTNAFDKLNYVLTLVDLSVKTQTVKKMFDSKKFYDLNNASKLAAIIKKNKSPKLFEHEFFDSFINSVWKYPIFLVAFWNAFCDLKQCKDGYENKLDKTHCSNDLCVLNLSSKLFKKCKEANEGNLAIQLLNKSFIDLLIKFSKREKKLVNSILVDFTDSVKSVDDETKIGFLKNILFEEGLLNFDTVTNSKTIITLTNNLSFNGISELADFYKEVLDFKRELTEFESKNKGIIICLNYFTKLINNPSCYEETNWRLSQLIYLLKKGFLQLKDNVNREFRQQVQEAFLTSLGHRFPNLECFHKVLQGIVNQMKIFLLDESATIVKFTDEMKEAWKTSVTLSEKIDKCLQKGGEKKEILLVLKIILQYMSILLLKEPSTAINNIQDLHHIFEDLINEKDENVWIEVLIDLFLNLLSKPYYHHRHLIRSTFKSLCPHLTEKSFLQIVEVIKLSYDSQEIGDEEDASDDSDSSKSSDEEEEEMECSDEEITTNEKLRFELRNALGGGSDNESIDLDEMDEEEGKKLDETLSSIFRANIKRRKTDYLSKYQNQLAHFRSRVMDLIEMCTEVALPLSYWLKVLVPLIELLGTTVGQNKLDFLRSRITCCLKKLNSSRVLQDETSMDDIVKVLENLLEKASKSSGVFADIKTDLVLAIKFILKSSKPFKSGLKTKKIEKNAIFAVYKNYLDGFFTGKNNLPVQLLTGLTSIGWDGMLVLIPDILRYSFDENVKTHKKLTGLKIVDMFCKTPQYFDGHLDKYYYLYLPSIQEIFSASISKEIDNTHSKEMNLKYFSDLFQLVNMIISRQNNSQLPLLINTEDLKKIIESHVTRFPTMKGKCKKNFLKLCNTLSLNYSSKQDTKVKLDTSVTSPKSLLKRKRKSDTIVKKKKKIKRLTKTINNE